MCTFTKETFKHTGQLHLHGLFMAKQTMLLFEKYVKKHTLVNSYSFQPSQTLVLFTKVFKTGRKHLKNLGSSSDQILSSSLLLS